MALDFDALERRIPDVVSTDDLPVLLAAEVDFLAARTDRWTHCRSVGPILRARALALAGDLPGAHAELADVDPADLSPGEAITAAWAVARAGFGSLAEPLMHRLRAIEEPFVVDPVPYGPTSTAIGQLFAVLGDLDAAEDELRRAVTVGDQRAPLWGVLARIELARVLRCAEAVGAPSDGRDRCAESNRAERSARTFLLAGGYRALLDRLDRDLGGSTVGGPTGGLLCPGDRWTIGLGLEPPVHVRPSKGLTAIRYLVENRDRSVAAVEVARLLDGGDVEPFVEFARAGRERTDQDALTVTELRELLVDDVARSRVSKLIRRTIESIADSHRLLAQHLSGSITTGNACRYGPAGTREVVWSLTPNDVGSSPPTW